MTSDTFITLIKRLRAGEEQAWSELARDYGAVVLQVARSRLGEKNLTAILDEEDVRQSVLRSLFLRMADGQYTLREPRQLVALLSVMARNKSINRIKSESRRAHAELPSEWPAPDVSSPVHISSMKERLECILRQLTDVERRIFHLRTAGYSWNEISSEVGLTADAIRKRLRRCLKRAGAQELIDWTDS
jgi:RNA polymerase sigma factor (sigma-70 family)